MGGTLNFAFLKELFRETLLEPRSAAGRVLGLGIPQEALWTALVLMAILNAMVTLALLYLSPPADPAMMSMVGASFASPILVTLSIVISLVLTIFALSWVGRSMGGTGSTNDILALVTWFQALQLVARLCIVVTLLTVPPVGAILSLAASIWGIVIFVAFVDRAHGFGSGFKAFGVVVMSLLAIAVGLSLVLSILGTAIMSGGA